MPKSGREPAAAKKAKLFARYYLVDLDASNAAVKAGYAASRGQELLRYEDVREEIARLKAKRSTRLDIQADDVLEVIWGQLQELAGADLAELYDEEQRLRPVDQWPKAFRNGLVTSIKTRDIFGRSRDGEVKDEEGRKSWDKAGVITEVKLANVKELLTKFIELAGRHVNVKAFPVAASANAGDQPKEIIVRWGGPTPQVLNAPAPRLIEAEVTK